MQRTRNVVLIAAFALSLGGCREEHTRLVTAPSVPSAPSADILNPSGTNLQNESARLFTGFTLYFASSALHAINGDLAAQPPKSADAERRALLLAGLTIDLFRDGQLQGGRATATRDLALSFIIELLRYVGFPLPPIDPSALDGGESVIQPCVAAVGCQVTVPSNNARITIPAGALPSDVLVTVFRLVDNAEEVDAQHHDAGGNTTYPLVYDFATRPAVSLTQNATFEICYYGTGVRAPAPAVVSQLQVAHYKAGVPELFPHAQGSLPCGTTGGQTTAIAGTGGGFSPYGLAAPGSQVSSVVVEPEAWSTDPTGAYMVAVPPTGLGPWADQIYVSAKDANGALIPGVTCTLSDPVGGTTWLPSTFTTGQYRSDTEFTRSDVTPLGPSTLTATCGGVSASIRILLFLE